ncbi:hypothetical protein ALO_12731 [Acetonema longum DSM 6540]|uniref:Uncharacterized protein n=1 Tax=Acetonema longum DSM 6540 TaxID=1009370 RepID=F7NKD3_9FIRM|nr:hypothetical protein ALO_12731 [Acetonema longum DSM 6540]
MLFGREKERKEGISVSLDIKADTELDTKVAEWGRRSVEILVVPPEKPFRMEW